MYGDSYWNSRLDMLSSITWSHGIAWGEYLVVFYCFPQKYSWEEPAGYTIQPNDQVSMFFLSLYREFFRGLYVLVLITLLGNFVAIDAWIHLMGLSSLIPFCRGRIIEQRFNNDWRTIGLWFFGSWQVYMIGNLKWRRMICAKFWTKTFYGTWRCGLVWSIHMAGVGIIISTR